MCFSMLINIMMKTRLVAAIKPVVLTIKKLGSHTQNLQQAK